MRVRARAHIIKFSRARVCACASHKISACECVRVRNFLNFRVRVRARAHFVKFSRAGACACVNKKDVIWAQKS